MIKNNNIDNNKNNNNNNDNVIIIIIIIIIIVIQIEINSYIIMKGKDNDINDENNAQNKDINRYYKKTGVHVNYHS